MGQLREFREYASQLDGEYNAIPNKPKPAKKKKVERVKQAPKPPRIFNYTCECCAKKYTTKKIYHKICKSCYYKEKIAKDEVSEEYRRMFG